MPRAAVSSGLVFFLPLFFLFLILALAWAFRTHQCKIARWNSSQNLLRATQPLFP